MKITREWFKEFNISAEQAESWFKQAKSGENFTFWCLENQKIDKNKYFQWAKNHYKLPVIKPHFFENLHETPWWSIVSSVSNWSESFLPIAEWDNTIFIACVEPKEGTHWSFPVQFLLTDPDNLKKWWEHLNSNLPTTSQPHMALTDNSQAVIAPSPPIIEMPPLPPQAQDADVPTSSDSRNLKPQDLSSLDSSAIAMPPSTVEPESIETFQISAEVPEEFEMPQGFEAPEGFNLDPQSFSPKISAEAPEGIEMPQGFEAPEGFNLDPQSFAPKISAEAPEGIEMPQGFEAPEQPAEQTIVVMNHPQAAPTHQTNLTPQVQSGLNSAGMPTDKLSNTKFLNLVDESYTNYEALMVLMFEEDQLRPWVHDGKWIAKNSTAYDPFKIQQACIFKIVKNSAQPFHGPVSHNEINDSFFQKWNFSQSPGFVTLTPIKYDSYLAGMVLAVGSEEKCNSLLALEKMERITETIKPFIESFSKAA